MSPSRKFDLYYMHSQTVFSVSAAMIGVCLTAIGLVKVVTRDPGVVTFCDDLIVIDALCFGLATAIGFRNMRHLIKGWPNPLAPAIDYVFFLALALMIIICGVFSWTMI